MKPNPWFGPEEADRQIPRRVWARRLALGRIKALVVPSQTLVAIAREIWRLPPEKIRYIPNGVDCDLFAAAGDESAAPGFARRDGELIVGTIAPLRVEKNFKVIFVAFCGAVSWFFFCKIWCIQRYCRGAIIIIIIIIAAAAMSFMWCNCCHCCHSLCFSTSQCLYNVFQFCIAVVIKCTYNEN